MDVSKNGDDEFFSDGTPLPPDPLPGGDPQSRQPGITAGPNGRGTYRLIRSTDGRTYAVPKLGPAIAIPLAARGATASAPSSPPHCGAAPAKSAPPPR